MECDQRGTTWSNFTFTWLQLSFWKSKNTPRWIMSFMLFSLLARCIWGKRGQQENRSKELWGSKLAKSRTKLWRGNQLTLYIIGMLFPKQRNLFLNTPAKNSASLPSLLSFLNSISCWMHSNFNFNFQFLFVNSRRSQIGIKASMDSSKRHCSKYQRRRGWELRSAFGYFWSEYLKSRYFSEYWGIQRHISDFQNPSKWVPNVSRNILEYLGSSFRGFQSCPPPPNVSGSSGNGEGDGSSPR